MGSRRRGARKLLNLKDAKREEVNPASTISEVTPLTPSDHPRSLAVVSPRDI
jgi:hypothetical protein